jgi:predicted dehydrogenase
MGHYRWGILGTGNIASQFATDAAAGKIQLQAVSSRDLSKAQAFAQKFSIARAYGSEAELLADPTVDFVYIALPNSLHGDASRRAAQAGKHILCEKPWVATRADADSLLEEIRLADVFFMEAFMYRCHPQWAQVRTWIEEGSIGPIRTLEAHFGYHLKAQADNVRNQADLEGGALMDVGCYPVSLARWVTGEEPVRWRSLSRKAKGVDE